VEVPVTTRSRITAFCLVTLLAPGLAAPAVAQASPETRDEFRTTEVLAKRLWKQCRRADNALEESGVTVDSAKAYQDGIRESFDEAWRRYEGFLATLDEGQRATISAQVGRIEHLRTRLLNHLGAVDSLLAEDELAERRIVRRFHRVATVVMDWRRYLRQVERWLRI
jgi:hypothetical protein